MSHVVYTVCDLQHPPPPPTKKSTMSNYRKDMVFNSFFEDTCKKQKHKCFKHVLCLKKKIKNK